MKQIKRLLAIFKPYWGWFAFSQLMVLGTVFATLLLPTINGHLINNGVLAKNMQVIIFYAGWMLLAAFLGVVFDIVSTVIGVRFSEQTAHYLRKRIFDKVQTMSFGNIDRFRPSDLLVRLTSDVQNVKMAVLQTITTLFQAPFMLLAALVLVATQAPSLFWIMLVMLVVIGVLLAVYVKVVAPAFISRQKKLDRVNQVLREGLTGVRVVKAFVRQPFENRRFDTAAKDLRKASIIPQLTLSWLIPTVLFALFLGIDGILYFGGTKIFSGSGLQMGQVLAAAQYFIACIGPLVMLAVALPMITAASASTERIFRVLDDIADVQDRPDACSLDPQTLRGRIAFENVSFGYLGSDGKPSNTVLEGINLLVEPGQTIGFLGTTGSGKSSLVNLIPRFYDVTAGRITLDGVDLRDIPQDDLRKLVGICLQETNLFSGTIADNIKFGRPEATDDEILTYARAADAGDFVEAIPEQYDGRVARRGANFSGGQRQRLSIARALTLKPKVLILDDSTSACDVSTEARIQDAIKDQMRGVTQLLVAQRISTVITADKIVLLEHGRMVAEGNHEQLLASSPLYREIYDSQLGQGMLVSQGEAA